MVRKEDLLPVTYTWHSHEYILAISLFSAILLPLVDHILRADHYNSQIPIQSTAVESVLSYFIFVPRLS